MEAEAGPGVGAGDPRDEHAVGVLGEVVAGERVDEVAITTEMGARDGHGLALARGRGDAPGPGEERTGVGSEQRGHDERGHVLTAACGRDELRDGGRVTGGEQVQRLGRVEVGHAHEHPGRR